MSFYIRNGLLQFTVGVEHTSAAKKFRFRTAQTVVYGDHRPELIYLLRNFLEYYTRRIAARLKIDQSGVSIETPEVYHQFCCSHQSFKASPSFYAGRFNLGSSPTSSPVRPTL